MHTFDTLTGTIAHSGLLLIQLTKLNYILNLVHSFDTLTGIWTEQLVDEAWTRMGHSASLLDPRRILIYGGELAQPQDLRNSKARLSRDLLILDTAAMCASAVTVNGEAPPSRSFHSASLVPASVHSASAATAMVPGAKPAPVAEKRGEWGEALEASALYVFGGKLGGVSVNDLMVFDTATRTWSYPGMPVLAGLFYSSIRPLLTLVRTQPRVADSRTLASGIRAPSSDMTTAAQQVLGLFWLCIRSLLAVY